MATKKPVARKAKTDDSGKGILFWSLLLLGLIIASIATFYVLKIQQETAVPKMEFVKLGKVSAHVAGKRLVQTEIDLEVKDASVGAALEGRKPEIKSAIESSFAQASEAQIQTIEGKIQVQEDIRKGLNRMLGKRLVKEVLFSNFTLE